MYVCVCVRACVCMGVCRLQRLTYETPILNPRILDYIPGASAIYVYLHVKVYEYIYIWS